MSDIDRLYLGTWQFGGQFKPLTPSEIRGLIADAIAQGINRFDTAAVYGNGSVETLLGECLPNDAIVVTKIPARRKPNLDELASVAEFYDLEYMQKCLKSSLLRLGRSHVHTTLLHNWLPQWGSGSEVVLEALSALKQCGMTQRIGLSLPDGFGVSLDANVLSYIDVIEAPYNAENRWILPELPRCREQGVEVILRSLFMQGKTVKGQSPNDTLRRVMQLGTSLVIGMTTRAQIKANTEIMRNHHD